MHLFYLQQDSPAPSHTPQVPNCSLAYEAKEPYLRLYSPLYSITHEGLENKGNETAES